MSTICAALSGNSPTTCRLYTLWTHDHYSSLYSINSFIANVVYYITIPSLNTVLYLVSSMYLVLFSGNS